MKEAFWIIDQLVQQGVRHFCVAPGSRSTPLVLAAADHRGAKIHVHYDERGIGFYALGIAKATRQPAAVIATSGTAVGNLLPSIMEAHHTCTPLIVLTSDRPAELRDCSANQTTDQVKIFQSFVRWQVDLPSSLDDERYFRSAIAQGYFYTRQNPPGPVQINCPFREPLYVPNSSQKEGAPIHLEFPSHRARPQKKNASKGLVVIGRLPHPDDLHPILELANRLQWPVCADILSNARLFPTDEQILHFDWMEKPTPELVLHFGERVTSKRLLEWLKKIKPEYIHVSPWPVLQDSGRILTGRVQADATEFCANFEASSDPKWLLSWKELDRDPWIDDSSFTEAHAMRSLSGILASDYGVFLANGMPIRDGDHFLFPKKCRGFFGNRGLSGIDGNIATIAGLAEEMPLLGFIGDQACLHDLNSLPLLKKTKHPVVLIVSNNFGGGIFSHLPISASPHFETLFAAAHSWRFEKAAQMFDLPYFGFDALPKVFEAGQSAVVELITDRVENYKYQKKLSTACLRAPA